MKCSPYSHRNKWQQSKQLAYFILDFPQTLAAGAAITRPGYNLDFVTSEESRNSHADDNFVIDKENCFCDICHVSNLAGWN